MTIPKFLHGVHDIDGASLMEGYPGWIVVSEAIGRDPNSGDGRDYSQLANRGFGVVVRLNNAHDGVNGTIPAPEHYADFAKRCANFCAASTGIAVVIIGNEPNHSNEWVNGAKIDPHDYARCYRECRAAIKGVRPELPVLVAAVAPWNLQSGDWLAYLVDIAEVVGDACDGFALHAYTHGADPALIYSEEKRNGWYWHFRVYRDQLLAIFAALRDSVKGKLYLITEANQGDDPWTDADSGWVLNAYREIVDWNRGSNMPIAGLALYRSNRDDKWSFADKEGVKKDFRRTVERRYQPPQINAQKYSEAVQTHLPTVSTGTSAPPPPSKRDIDPRLTPRGVTIETPNLPPGEVYWRVVHARWYSEAEAGGRRHLYIETIAPDGRTVAGVPFEVRWPSGEDIAHTKAGRGFDAGNIPLSPSRNEFSVRIADGVPSETVKGIGMGADTPDGFNPGIHTSTLVTYQLTTVPQPAPEPEPSQPEPAQPPALVPKLAHPVQDPTKRVISQRFGENPDAYALFGLAGHTGIDFACPVGTAICAVDDGVPVEIENDFGGYGIYVKVRHTWGESLYAHLSQELCDVGKPLVAGETLGLSGNTGNSTGPHLHLGIRVYPYKRGWPYDGFSDPAPYLQDTATPQPVSRRDVVRSIRAAAQEFGLDPYLLLSLAWAESSFDPRAESHAGARGLLQIMPATWDEYAPRLGANDPFDARDSARVGSAYLSWLIGYLQGNERKALWAYNWGIGRVVAGSEPPAETIEFASKIIHGRDLLKAMEA